MDGERLLTRHRQFGGVASQLRERVVRTRDFEEGIGGDGRIRGIRDFEGNDLVRRGHLDADTFPIGHGRVARIAGQK